VLTGSLLLLAAVHAVGVRWGAATIYLLTAAKLAPLVIFVVAALVAWPTNPFPASLTLPGEETRWSDAALFMLFAYAGFENVGVPAGEYKDPRRHLPLALLLGTFGIAVLYALVQLAAMVALPDLGSSETPIADAAALVIGPLGVVLVSVGATLSILGTNSGTMLEGSRTLFALAVGRRPYRWIAWVHPRFHTPVVAIAVHTAAAIPLALGGSFASLALLSTVARMTTYLVTCASVPRLARKHGPTFRIPNWLAWLGVAISLALFLTLRREHLLAALAALAVGGLLYALDRALPAPELTLAEAEREAEARAEAADGRS
jgi:amino acid transporter